MEFCLGIGLGQVHDAKSGRAYSSFHIKNSLSVCSQVLIHFFQETFIASFSSTLDPLILTLLYCIQHFYLFIVY